jgi:hypothetical protein
MQSSTSPLIRFFAILLIGAGAIFISAGKSYAQCGGSIGVAGTNSGTQFLICFMQNNDTSDVTGYQDIYLASVDTNQVDTVTITCNAYPALKKIFLLTAKQPATVWRVSTDPAVTHFGLIYSSDTIDEMVFKINASSPMTCYGMNSKFQTADAFIAFPINVASPDYTVMSYPSSDLAGVERPSEFCVAAFKDNTPLDIVPTTPIVTRDVKGRLDTNGRGVKGIVPAHTKLHFVLNAGECVQIQSIADTNRYDLTGSTITVNVADKPVAVYSGNARTEVPNPLGVGASVSRDHLAEAMPPVTDWGTSFITGNFCDPKGITRPYGDIMRIIASLDGTVVNINGIPWGKPFKKNGFRDTLIAYSPVALDNIAAVTASNPILVGMIAHTAAPVVGGESYGDPFLAIVPPLDQLWNDYTYFITQDQTNFDPSEQFLVIVTQQANKGSIRINGTLIPSQFFTDVPPLNGNSYSIATIGQGLGINHITSPASTGFSILAYGWGDVISYGYTAGLLFKPTVAIHPLSPPSQPTAPYPGHPSLSPENIIVRNILNEKVYFDSATISYTQNPDHATVRLKDDIALVTGTIESAEEKTLDLVSDKPVTNIIKGSVRIWYHSALWFDMYPVDFPFTITPAQQSAGVTDAGIAAAFLENYPNPSTGRTTVHFWIPSRAAVCVKIYDALGRTVRTVMQGMTNGEETVQVSTKGLPAGEYTLELLAPELGITKHQHLIVLE